MEGAKLRDDEGEGARVLVLDTARDAPGELNGDCDKDCESSCDGVREAADDVLVAEDRWVED